MMEIILRKYRAKRNFTLRRFAKLINTKPELVDRYEIGKNDVSMHFLVKIASVLNVNIFDLVKPPG